MIKSTEEMKEAKAYTPIFILAPASRDGKPDGEPIGLARLISDDEILILDNFLNRTRRNIEENPWVAISFWSVELTGMGISSKEKPV